MWTEHPQWVGWWLLVGTTGVLAVGMAAMALRGERSKWDLQAWWAVLHILALTVGVAMATPSWVHVVIGPIAALAVVFITHWTIRRSQPGYSPVRRISELEAEAASLRAELERPQSRELPPTLTEAIHRARVYVAALEVAVNLDPDRSLFLVDHDLVMWELGGGPLARAGHDREKIKGLRVDEVLPTGSKVPDAYRAALNGRCVYLVHPKINGIEHETIFTPVGLGEDVVAAVALSRELGTEQAPWSELVEGAT